jgi:AcrR family transcriptional regulator
MDDIAKSCGISKKTLYENIKDKNELVKFVIESEFHKDEPESINFDKNMSAIDQLFIGYLAMIEFFKNFNMSFEYDLQKYYPKLYQLATKKRRKRIYEKTIENIKKGQAEGFYRTDFNLDIITKIHIVKIEGILTTDLFENDNYSISEIFKELFIHHFMGVATPKGVKAFYEKLEKVKDKI